MFVKFVIHKKLGEIAPKCSFHLAIHIKYNFEPIKYGIYVSQWEICLIFINMTHHFQSDIPQHSYSTKSVNNSQNCRNFRCHTVFENKIDNSFIDETCSHTYLKIACRTLDLCLIGR